MPKCPHCGDMVKGNNQLKTHVESMHGDSKFKCTQCEFESTRNYHLKRHGDSNFKCIGCQFETTRKDKLKRHVQNIHGNTKFQCKQCEFEGTRKDNLKRHIKIKHGEPPVSTLQTDHGYTKESEPAKKKRRVEEEDLWGEPLTDSDIEMLDMNPIQHVEPVHVEPELVHVEPEPEKQRSRKKQRDGERKRKRRGGQGEM